MPPTPWSWETSMPTTPPGSLQHWISGGGSRATNHPSNRLQSLHLPQSDLPIRLPTNGSPSSPDLTIIKSWPCLGHHLYSHHLPQLRPPPNSHNPPEFTAPTLTSLLPCISTPFDLPALPPTLCSFLSIPYLSILINESSFCAWLHCW